MGKVIGIDLGTTNSCVAIMEGGKAVVIPNAEGSRITPSVVAFTKSGECLVGERAKRQAATNPDSTTCSIKRKMGSNYCVHIGNKNYMPQEISAMILKKLKADAEDYLGEKVTQAVIAVPACFTNNQRQATMDAGRISGLDVLRIINEPAAAVLAYGLNKKAIETILVFDLGGGNSSVSILELGEGVFEVKAVNGNTRLGGDDFDEQIISYLIAEFKKSNGIDLSKSRLAMQRLKDAAEKAKCDLSTVMQSTISLPFIANTTDYSQHLVIALTRVKLEELIADLVNKAVGITRQAMADAMLNSKEIDKVLLIGGSTRVPMVAESIRILLGEKPYRMPSSNEVVAMGAAIQAGLLMGEVKDIVLLDAASLSLGIEATDGKMTWIIRRNTTIPTLAIKMFTTTVDFQTSIDIHVLQGENVMAAENETVGHFQIIGIIPAKRGVPQIEVSFAIYVDGSLKVDAQDKVSGKKQTVVIGGSSNPDKDKIDRTVSNDQDNAELKKIRRQGEAERPSKDVRDKVFNIDINQTIDKVARNAYRILGLPAEALPASISESTQSIRRALKLGVDKETTWDLTWLGNVARNEPSVQDAVSRLSNPYQRLLERLFWFSEKENIITGLSDKSFLSAVKSLLNKAAVDVAVTLFGGTSTSPTPSYHECALLGIIAAVSFDPSFNDASLWINVINTWMLVVDTDHYWLQQTEIEETAKFEPQATNDEINQLRNGTIEYVISIIGGIVKNAFHQDEPQIITKASRILKAAHVPDAIVFNLQNETIGTLVSNLENICLEIQNECKAIHDDKSTEQNRILCARAMNRIDNEATLLDVKIASLIDDVDSNILIQAHEIVAKCLRGIAIEWTWADDFIQAESVLQRAKVMAYRTLVAVQIDDDLVRISANAKIQRDFINNENVRKEALKGKHIHKQSWGFPPIIARIVAIIIVAILYGLISSLFHTSNNNAQSPQPTPIVQTDGTSNSSDNFSSEIDTKKQAIDSVEAQLNQINSEMNTYQNQINYWEGLIKEGEPINQVAYQQALDHYNSLVPTQNQLVNEDKSLTAQYNGMVDQYNAQQ